MATFYVSLIVSRSAGLDDEALIRLFRGAAERAVCVPIEVAPTGLIVEAEAPSLATLEGTLREEMQRIGGRVERLSVTRFWMVSFVPRSRSHSARNET
jgi:hypothetical protein